MRQQPNTHLYKPASKHSHVLWACKVFDYLAGSVTLGQAAHSIQDESFGIQEVRETVGNRKTTKYLL